MAMSMASIGFRTKTGKAIAVALTNRNSPEFVQRWNLELYDRDVPETGQPHHEVMELPWPRAQLAVRRFEEIIENVATERLRTLLEELRSRPFTFDRSPLSALRIATWRRSGIPISARTPQRLYRSRSFAGSCGERLPRLRLPSLSC